MERKPEISGFILAGGKSSRMGTNKALLTFRNEPLLKYMANLIEPFCSSIAISGVHTDYHEFGINMVPDQYPDCGPIAGIYSSLQYSQTDWNLLVSVDAPFVNEELFRYLLANIGNCDCIIPKHASGVEPLIGLYHKSIWPVINGMIEDGDFKLMNLLSKLNTRFLDCYELIKKHPRLFLNINRMEDYLSI